MRVLTALIVLALTAGGIMKLVAPTEIINIYTKIGLLAYMKVLGVAELLFAFLFLWNRTMKTGFYLLTAYLGGAMAVELSHGNIFIAPTITLAVTWITAFLRDPSIFRTEVKFIPAYEK